MFLVILSTFSLSAQITTIWLEDFSGVPDGVVIDDGSYTPINTAWSVDNSACSINPGDYSEVQSNSFRVSDNDGWSVWISDIIDISGFSNANITVDLFEVGNNSGDYIRVYYVLDGSPEIQLTNGNQSNNFFSATASVDGLSGSDLTIIVRIYHTTGSSANYYGFDNVNVFYEPETRYAIVDGGNWNDGNTWSYTPGGVSCGCIPDELSETYTNGRDVVIDGSADTKDLTVESGDNVTYNGGFTLTINNSGTLTVENGAQINHSGNLGDISFANGGSPELVVNDNSPGIYVDEIYIDDINDLTISGIGSITTVDDFEFTSQNVTVTNNITTLNIGDGTDGDANLNLNGGPGSGSNSFINNGFVDIYIGIWAGATNQTITNNGTFVFNTFNAQNSNIVFDNYNTVDQNGDFINIGTTEIIRNHLNSSWAWSGQNSNGINLDCDVDGENTFIYDRAGYADNDQNIINPVDGYWHLEISGSGTKDALNNLDINGDLTISSTFDPNNNIVNLAGNWDNTGGFTQGTGTVIFDGTDNQTISNSGTEVFYDFEIDKASGNVILLTDISVTNLLTFSNGLVRSNGNQFLHNNPNAGSLTPGNGWVIGAFDRNIGNTSSNYEFPVGMSTRQNSLTFNSIAGTGILSVEFDSTDPGDAGLSVIDGAFSIYHQFPEGFWKLDPVSLSSTNYSISVNTNGFNTFTKSATDTRLIHRNSGGNWDVVGNHVAYADPDAGRAGINGIASGTEFGLGHCQCITPTIDEEPSSISDICAGSDTLFGVQASGFGTLTYQWYKVGSPDIQLANGGNISGATSDTLRLTNVAVSDAGDYYCVVDNLCAGETQSASASVVIAAQPATPTLNVKTPNLASVCEGQDVSATFTSQGGGVGCADEYEYSFDGSTWNSYTPGNNISTTGQDGNTLTIRGQRSGCTAGAGCSASGWSNLTTWVIAAQPATPTLNVKTPNLASVCEGQDVSATFTSQGGGVGCADEYEYSFDGSTWNSYTPGNNISTTGQDGNTLTIRGQRSGCTAGAGCSASGWSNLTTWVIAAQPATPTLNVKTPNLASVCEGQDVSATFTSQGGGVGCADEYEYSFDGSTWNSYTPGNNISTTGQDGNTLTIRGQRSGCTAGAGCSASGWSNLTTWVIAAQPATPTLNVKTPNLASVCEGQDVSATFTSQGGGVGCADEYEYSFDGSTWNSYTPGNNISTTGQDGNTLTIRGQRSGCTAGAGCSASGWSNLTTWVIAAQPATPTLNVKTPNLASVCEGQDVSATFTSQGGGVGCADEYEYSFDGSTWNSYTPGNNISTTGQDGNTLTIRGQRSGCTAGAGCSASGWSNLTTWVIAAQPATPTLNVKTPNLASVCEGQDVSATFTSQGGGVGCADEYEYSFDGSTWNSYTPGNNISTTGQDGNTLTIRGQRSGCTAGAGCSASGWSNLTTWVIAAQPATPTLNVKTPNLASVCEGQDVSATFTSQGGGVGCADEYEYSFDGSTWNSYTPGNNISTTGQDGNTLTIRGQRSGCTAGAGCSASGWSNLTTWVIAAQPATPTLNVKTPNLASVCEGQDVSATFTSQGGGVGCADEYEYSFDGSTWNSYTPGNNISTTGQDGNTLTIRGQRSGCTAGAGCSASGWSNLTTWVIAAQPATPTLNVKTPNLASVCEGQDVSATFTSQGGGVGCADEYEYSFDGSTWNSYTPGNNISTTGQDGNTLTIRGQRSGCTAGAGCSASGWSNLTTWVIAAQPATPTLNVKTPNLASVCEGQDVSATFTSQGGGVGCADEYEYSFDGSTWNSYTPGNNISTTGQDGNTLTIRGQRSGCTAGAGCSASGWSNLTTWVIAAQPATPTLNVKTPNLASVCEGQDVSATFTSQGGGVGCADEYEYSFDGSTWNSYTPGNNISTTGQDGNTLTIRGQRSGCTAGAGCSASGWSNLTTWVIAAQPATPTLNVKTPNLASVCEGQDVSATFTSQGGGVGCADEYEYSFDGSTWNSYTPGNNISTTGQDGNTLTIRGQRSGCTAGAGCSASGWSNLTTWVIAAQPATPTLNVKTPNLASVCEGQDVSATFTSQGGGVGCADEYEYSFDGSTWNSYTPGNNISTTGQDGNTLTIRGQRSGCTAGAGCSASGWSNLTTWVIAAQPATPTLNVKTPNLASVCEGQDVSATFTSQGGGVGCADEYEYSFDGSTWNSYTPGNNISTTGQDGNTLTIRGQRSGCTAGAGCSASGWSNLTTWVIAAQPATPTLNVKTPNLASVCEGQDVSATFTSQGGGVGCADEYEYSFDGSTWNSYTPGNNISTTGQDGNTLTIRGQRSGCTAGAGCSASGWSNLTTWVIAAQPATPTLNVKTPNLASVCEGQDVSATFTSQGGGVGCADEYEYSFDGSTWNSYTPGNNISTTGQDGNTLTIRGQRSGCTAGAGCSASGWSNLTTWTVNPIPQVNLSTEHDTICSGEQSSIEISSSIAGTTYDISVIPTGTTITGANAIFDGTCITDILVNSGSSVDSVMYRIVPIGPLPTNCSGEADTITILVEPGLIATPSPAADTICNKQTVSIELISPTVTSLPLRFSYEIIPDDASSVTIGYDTIDGTIALEEGMFIKDTLTNTSNIAQRALFRITPYLLGGGGTGCPGADFDVVVWVNPTPEIIVAVDDTICNNNSADFTISNPNTQRGTWRYDVSVAYPADVTGDWAAGLTNSTDINLSDNLVNASQDVQAVAYTFTPHINPEDGGADCQDGIDTVITVYINPTPEIIVAVDDTICNNNSADFTISNPNTQRGTWRYDVSVAYPADVTGDWAAGLTNSTDINLSDNLVNASQDVQAVAYTFTPHINPEDGGADCQDGIDTVITVYINPTPEIIVAVDDTICNNNSADFTISNPNTQRGTWRYDVSVAYPADVTGDWAAGLTNSTDINLSDNLVNASQDVQAVTYTFTPHINPEDGGADCQDGIDTVITVYINPTPEIIVAVDDTICNNNSADFTISNPNTQRGTWRYDVSVAYPADVTGDWAAGLTNRTDINLTDNLVNASQDVQAVAYTFTPHINPEDGGADCQDGIDTVITVYINPTPEIIVAVDDTICNNNSADFTISNPNTQRGTWRYDVSVAYPADVTGDWAAGLTNSTDINLSDNLVNASQDVQAVAYTFTPHINPEDGGADCQDGIDTVITVYINPTPEIIVAVDDTICNNNSADFTISNPNTQRGTWRYDVSVAYPADVTGDWAAGLTNSTDINLSDNLVNASQDVQAVTYTFTPHINPEDGGADCQDGIDTVITVYINPTPEIIVAVDDTICNNNSADFTISNPNTQRGTWRYDVSVAYPADVTGDWAAGLTNRTDINLSDNLVNASQDVQAVTYTFTPHINPEDGGADCQDGIDTVITVYINPTPEIIVAVDDTICNNNSADFTISNPNTQRGTWRYDVSVAYPADVTGDWAAGLTNSTDINLSDNLVNASQDVQAVAYTFTPHINPEDGGADCQDGIDTVITVYINPTPEIIVAVDDTICNNNSADFTISNPNTQRGTWRYDVSVAYPADVTGDWAAGLTNSTDINLSDNLVNASQDVQAVTYTFTPHINPEDGGADCQDGIDTVITVYINPTPEIIVAVDDTICNNNSADFTISNPNTQRGTWRYDVSVAYPADVTGDWAAGLTNRTDINLSDNLVNASQDVQAVTYTFTPHINPEDGGADCQDGIDTVITVYINPTPEIIVAVDDTICNNNSADFTISNPNTQRGTWRYDVSVAYPADVTGDWAAGLTNSTDINLSDNLVNASQDVQAVTYTFTPHINPEDGGAECLGGIDTLVTIWIEPTPVVTITPDEDTICAGDITALQLTSISNPSYPVEFEYFAFAENPAMVEITHIGDTAGLVVNDLIEDRLENISDTAQSVIYKVVPYIVDGAGDKKCNGDTVIAEVIIEPALIAILLPDEDTLCDNDALAIEINSTSKTSLPLRFEYEIVPSNLTEVDIKYDTIVNGTFALEIGDIITDTLVNLSNEVQRIEIRVTPYVVGGNGNGCPGVEEIAVIWLEPKPELSVSIADTIVCDSSEIVIAVNDLVGITRGAKVYQLISSNASGNVIGVQPSGEYTAGLNVTDTLENISNDVQIVTYQFIARINNSGGYCNNGTDTTISIHVNPKPRIGVTVDDTLCNNNSADFTINNPNTVRGTWRYDVSVAYPAGITGDWSAGLSDQTVGNLSDNLVNSSQDVQAVTYTFTPHIDPEDGDAECQNGIDTIITVYINPTPEIEVSVDDTLCNNNSADFTIVNPNTVGGSWRYDVSVAYPAGITGDWSAGLSDQTVGNLSDNLVNSSQDVQAVTYTFTPHINPEDGDPECQNGIDTIITVYVNPTPEIEVSVDDTLCNNNSADFTIVNPNTVRGSWRYDVSVAYPADVSGDWTTGLTNQTASNLSDNLINASQDVQAVTYTFTPHINPEDGDSECQNGIDTIITVYVNPTPEIEVSVDDTLCNNNSADFTIVNPNTVTGLWRYDVSVAYPAGITGDWSAGLSDQTVGNLSDNLVNSSQDVQAVTYTFTPHINPEDGDPECQNGIDTIITVYVNPTPEIEVSVDDTLCNNNSADFTIVNPNTVRGSWRYDVSVAYPADVSGDWTTGLTNQTASNLSDNLINASQDVQAVTYTFTPHINPEDGDSECQNGIDTIITVYVNPTPEIEVSVDDTLCNNNSADFTMVNPNTVRGSWRYDVSVAYPADVSGDWTTGLTDQTVGNLSDNLVNSSQDVQAVTYTFTPHINPEDGHAECQGGIDTIITVYINPTPEIEVSVEDTICNNNSADFTIVNPNTVRGTWRYDVSVAYPADVSGDWAAGLINQTLSGLSDNLINTSDNAQIVTYTFTPHINPEDGDAECQNGIDTVITIWVEPTPKVTAAASLDTICSTDFAEIALESVTVPTRQVKFRWRAWSEFPGNISGIPLDSSIWQYGGGLNVDSLITTQLFNNTNDDQRVFFEVEGYTIDADSNVHCTNGISDTVTIVVLPGLLVDLAPQADTLCDNSNVSIELSTVSNPSGTLLFRYNVEPENPSDIAITYTNAPDTLGVGLPYTITDNLVNLSDTAQLVRFIVTPFLQGGIGCPGTPDTTYIWINPTPDIYVSAIPDTICNEATVDFNIDSITIGTTGRWAVDITAVPSDASVSGFTNASDTSIIAFSDVLVNTSDDAQYVDYTFHPKIVNPRTGLPYCHDGSSLNDTTIRIWINPTPDIYVSAIPDTICNEATVDFNIDSITNGTTGRWALDITAVPSDANVSGFTNASDTSIIAFSDVLLNTSDDAQYVDYTFHPKIVNPRTGLPYCHDGSSLNDTTIRIWINPTPDIYVSAIPDTICNEATVDFNIDSITNGTTGRWAVDITAVPSDASVSGFTNASDTSISAFSDVLVNTSDDAQYVDYTFHPKIVNPRTGLPYCHDGSSLNDTTIRIWINPTPDIYVSAIPDTICNEATVDFNIDSITNGTTGRWAVDITAVPSDASVSGFTNASDTSISAFSDVLVNTSDDAQYVDYTFHPKIVNPRTGLAYCNGSILNDTTIRIWINPTPDIYVSAIPDTICNEATVDFNIDSITNGTTGRWAVDITAVPSDASVSGFTNASDTSIIAFSDVLLNTSDDAQYVDYTFHPKIVNPHSGLPYCDNGSVSNDTTIRIWINPTPDIYISAIPDTICNEATVDFNIDSITNGTTGRWAVDITAVPSDASVSGFTNASDTSIIAFSDVLVNTSDDAQYVDYTFHPKIVNPSTGLPYCHDGSSLNDTTIRIWINPTPDIYVSAIPDTICNEATVDFNIDSITNGTTGRWAVDITAVPSNASVSGFTNASDTSISAFSDVLVNTSDDAQYVDYTFHPKIVNPRTGLAYCNGSILKDTTIRIWIEPTAKVHFDHYQDTICTGLTFDPIELQSVTNPIYEVRFDYTVTPQNIGQVNVVTNGPTTMLPDGTVISDSLYNLSGTVQEVYVIVTPYLLDRFNNPKCTGIADTIVIQLTPTLVMVDTAREYVKYNIDCYGNSNGAFYMYPYGGVLAFGSSVYDHQDINYSISGPGVSLPLYDSLATDVYKVDSLPAGIYTLSASDFSGCTTEKIDTLTQPESPLGVEIIEVDPITCVNPLGIVTVRKTGGTYFTSGSDTVGYETPFWIVYGFGGHDMPFDTIFNAQAGDYIVELTDTNGCLATDARGLYGEDIPKIENVLPNSFFGSYNISCKGASDGVIWARPNMLQDSLTYDFYNSDSSIFITDIAKSFRTWENLPAGEYSASVYLSDICKTVYSNFIELTEPEDSLRILDYSTSWYYDSTWNVSCSYSTDGAINIDSISMGLYRTPYYTWTRNEEYYNDTRNLDSIPEGSYKLVLDDGYCYDSTEINIIPPPAIEYSSIDSVNNLCNGDSTGQISVIATGGVLYGGDYHYQWSHDTTINSNIANNLTSGLYSITTTDSLGCNLVEFINIEQPDSLIIQNAITNYNGYGVSCYGSQNGEILLNVLGGTGARTYSWEYNGQPISGENYLTNLQAGNYVANIEDQNNCATSDTFEITQPVALSVTFNIRDKVCNVYGEATANVSGGVPDYSYEWLSEGLSTSTITDLIPDIYPLKITDKNNCALIDTAIVGESSSMSISLAEEKAVSCYLYNDGILAVSVDNATPPLTITWNGQPGSERLQNVNIGTYIVEIFDQNECHDYDTIVVNQPDDLIADFIVEAASCYDTADGGILLGAEGGNGDYLYFFEGNFVEGDEISDLLSGNYSISITDAKNCQTDTVITITQPNSLYVNEVLAERIPPSCPDAPNGKLMVEGTGGTEPYSFEWIDDEISGEILDNIDQGYYRIRIVDNNGCIDNKTIFLEAELPACLTIPNAFSPNGDQYNDVWDIVNPLDEDMDLSLIYPEMIVKVFNRWGQTVWVSERGYPRIKAWQGTDSNGRHLPVDSYHYIVYLNNGSGRTLTGIVTIVK